MRRPACRTGLGATSRARRPQNRRSTSGSRARSPGSRTAASSSERRRPLGRPVRRRRLPGVTRSAGRSARSSSTSSAQEFETLASNARSSGWMAGPYATVRLSNNLFFQARAAWGRSNAELGFDGSPDDRFDADRWLVRGTLIGQWRWGPWQLRPRISIGYIEERQETYLSSLGVAVPEQTLALGQVKGGPEISYRHRMADGTVIEPSLLLEGVWNFMQDAGVVAIDDHAFGEDLRGRVETASDGLHARRGERRRGGQLRRHRVG